MVDKRPDDQKSEYERLQAEHAERREDAPEPRNERQPAEKHRGGPLPDQKR